MASQIDQQLWKGVSSYIPLEETVRTSDMAGGLLEMVACEVVGCIGE